MRSLDFAPLVGANETLGVPGPDLLRDKLIPLNDEGAGFMGARLGVPPSRASLSRWRSDGYPVERNGPKVLLPYVIRLKKVYTSANAMARWFRLVQALGEDIQASGGVSKWRSTGGMKKWEQRQDQRRPGR